MSPEAINKAIAKACGWTKVGEGDDQLWSHPRKAVFGKPSMFLPAYLDDLNAMHDAEKALDTTASPGGRDSEWDRYKGFLEEICIRDDTDIISATAAQRAEAILRTLGLWQDSEGK